ncbi:hypothetical protein BDR05DRAFT_157147 [Suillus weaverae]|nr:hypothetical protein BDR05DRAFT_157147 [Suillus weaverae]
MRPTYLRVASACIHHMFRPACVTWLLCESFGLHASHALARHRGAHSVLMPVTTRGQRFVVVNLSCLHDQHCVRSPFGMACIWHIRQGCWHWRKDSFLMPIRSHLIVTVQ